MLCLVFEARRLQSRVPVPHRSKHEAVAGALLAGDRSVRLAHPASE